MKALITGGAGFIGSHLVDLLLSGVDGNLKSVNRACCDLLGRSAEEVKGRKLFSVFSQPDQRGQSIERYLGFFEQEPVRTSLMTVRVQNAPTESERNATCCAMEFDHSKFLVTQLI